MKAIVCKVFGPPEALVLEEVPSRPISPSEVRVAVKAAGINFPDTLIIQGKYQMKAEPPFIPGAEVAGTVTEVGAKVQHVKVGDEVAAIVPVGGYAEEVVAAGDVVIRLPKGMTHAQAAGFPLVYGTSMHALKQRGQLKAGETLLVLGAAGGVGLSAVQIGKLMGARVIAAASSPEKLALCREHGADEVIDYSKESLKEAVKKLTKGQGADVIYDPVGGDLAQECFSSIAWNGRYLVIGFASGTIPEVAVNRLLLKGASAVGVFWGAFIAREPKVSAENFQQLFAWFLEGKMTPHVSQQYPLADAPKALRDMLERKATGKLILVP
ncbi:NADPH:quinone oxidoreductase family protein [Stenotrophobium rhamnosiphilum]|uniref:NADPH:quinone oxidoreductase n=1 Tax=Stenotrophobium rhamnosiphilum TaxID=2029166 RepID=A0A2T5MJF5_9GAMM|nr:NADPH:quinone oxidoreductase family protein [Stenotrophobium rhamnosiphilum]PTU32688.1 NADPH:quinone oxidoreductase [Stenotrophobium rhamnosiphilum]